MNQSRDTFVYLIAHRDGNIFLAPIKVGVSNTPDERLATFQTSCPHEIGLVIKIAYPTREIALKMEECFHVTQKPHRLRGEWFDIPPHQATQLLRLHLRFALSAFASELSDEDHDSAIEIAERYL